MNLMRLRISFIYFCIFEKYIMAEPFSSFFVCTVLGGSKVTPWQLIIEISCSPSATYRIYTTWSLQFRESAPDLVTSLTDRPPFYFFHVRIFHCWLSLVSWLAVALKWKKRECSRSWRLGKLSYGTYPGPAFTWRLVLVFLFLFMSSEEKSSRLLFRFGTGILTDLNGQR